MLEFVNNLKCFHEKNEGYGCEIELVYQQVILAIAEIVYNENFVVRRSTESCVNISCCSKNRQT